MQISAGMPSIQITPFQQGEQTKPVQQTPIVRKSEMTGDPDVDLARGFNPFLLLTDTDRSLIQKVTGIKIDAETGQSEPPSFSEDAYDFCKAVLDRRYDEYFAKAQPAPTTETSIRTMFQKAVATDHPLNPSFMQTALDWLMDGVKDGTSSEPKSRGSTVDIYA